LWGEIEIKMIAELLNENAEKENMINVLMTEFSDALGNDYARVETNPLFYFTQKALNDGRLFLFQMLGALPFDIIFYEEMKICL